ncbi:cysteinyl-tRNA synthetase [Geomicrobium halophilum]|uniref:Cysteine--tRNA ligase n=1 Tax=Geomicrobium halophilum TaxID=549000 RepID=A0A841PW05_9BACL|nr:cysteine--tRNA ligase [Geomicrobium halophilum]MBB6451436.1 cysteinyl-tRNA synthetase [Geomicrobium halophilum]
MGVQMYNTLTKQKETFRPIEEGKVNMYVCGPTVYNYIHIGNARPAVVFDMIRRYLIYRGYDVQYVTNFTDVDDKIINAAQEAGEDVFALAEKFIDKFFEDTSALGVKRADIHPRVTETMDDIIAFIEALIEKGYAYESGGDVYFKTKSFPDYGKLSGQSTDDLQAGARIEVGEQKQDPLDFSLWKRAKEDEVSWDSPWGYGRPGWHIECSAMVKKYLGDTIDIHAGGQDLAFPHHENEVAQSEALTGQQMANYWLHNGYIQIDNEKMSKSLGNFVLVNELIREHDPQVIRFFILQAHYRHPLNFNSELVEASGAGLSRIRNFLENVRHRHRTSADFADGTEWLKKIQTFKGRFIHEMDDDFNSANAITVLFDFVKEGNLYLQEPHTSKEVLQEVMNTFEEWGEVLGLSFFAEEELLSEDIEDYIEQRVKAREHKNFQEADRIRDLLKEKGIVLEDTPQGTRWKRVSSL